MWLIDRLADSRIEEAMRAGEFDDLPGQGERIAAEPETMVPEELRTAYRLLKISGFFPREVMLLREISEVEELMADLDYGELRSRAIKRLNLLRAQLGARGDSLELSARYTAGIVDKLDRG